MDISRTCYIRKWKCYKNSDATVLVESYRVPKGTPFLPFLHAFGNTDFLPMKDYGNPPINQVGELQVPSTYSNGKRPSPHMVGAAPIGTPDEWLDGVEVIINDNH